MARSIKEKSRNPYNYTPRLGRAKRAPWVFRYPRRAA